MKKTKPHRNKTLADKSAKKTKSTQETAPILAEQEQTLTIQQAIDLAVEHHNSGDLPKAEGIYQQILQADPNQPVALHLLGVIARQVGKNDIAVDLINKALAFKPDYAEAYSNLGLTLHEQKKFDEAVTSCSKAIVIKPDLAEAYYNLGNSFKELGKINDALDNYNKATTIKPDYPEVYINLGIALKGLGQLDVAVANYNKALAIKPDYPEAYLNLGNVLQQLGKYDEAVANYNKAIDIKSDYARAHNNRGNALKELGRFDEAVSSYKKALTINPDYAEVHLNMSVALLAKGMLKEGLDEYEWRWQDSEFPSRKRCFSRPMWNGAKDLKGRTILIWGEQGPQDMTIWSSCLPHLSSRAGHCILECPPKLISLFSRSFPNVEVRVENTVYNAKLDDFDFHLPMGSLFKHFIPEISNETKTDIFLVPDQSRVDYWRDRLNQLGTGPFVGISWKSPLMKPNRLPNYTQISDWSPIFSHRHITFINLQSKNFVDDLAEIQEKFGITVHNFDDLDHFDNLDDVAALSAALDIAISVSTAVAAITAGVGTPTKLIAWRQSAWSNILHAPRGPSVDVFERNTLEPWDTVFQSIANNVALSPYN
jgi:tetratricopeptide (TPR) repeat protein